MLVEASELGISFAKIHCSRTLHRISTPPRSNFPDRAVRIMPVMHFGIHSNGTHVDHALLLLLLLLLLAVSFFGLWVVRHPTSMGSKHSDINDFRSHSIVWARRALFRRRSDARNPEHAREA